ncbi:MAG: bifunctional adenosylcobinamide kinase/adenosylcobinamide-phosphate guanylyltransferase [Mucilaginibacter sp.]|uniref:bifunctional adenosylcobinamide kinase/adenosylcobinamide-phosphate guanylyltransferase n=1 Tax=Mucilaginibacter sp. TaxID=1882438 RepID=UPI0031AD48BF
MIIYISGGVRSGKSRFAQDMALKNSNAPVYIATAKIWDEDFAKRIKRHRDDRGEQWTTYETYQNLHLLPIQNQAVVIDCVTLWLTNIFMDDESDINKALNIFKNEIDNLSALSGTFIIVSNELGMGLHAETALGRRFTDLQGMANQYVAGKADEAIFMVSGLPLYLKKQ